MEDKVVIYLDLLGFSNFVNEDQDGAVEILRNFHDVLRIRRRFEQNQPASSMPDGQLKILAERNASDSFVHLIPMSDSMFIVSEQPDKVVEQLSTFLSNCFLYVAANYDSPTNVIQQPFTDVRVTASGNVERRHGRENWYPILFRGGISFGKLDVIENEGISYGQEVPFPNVVGQAVVRAVELEQIGLPGPRILVDGNFVEQLRRPVTKYLRRRGQVWELLWPGFKYLEDDDERSQSYVFGELFSPAWILWKHYFGQRPERHYRAFLELIVRSHLAFAESASNPDLVNEFLNQKLDEVGLRLYNSVKNTQLVFPTPKRK